VISPAPTTGSDAPWPECAPYRRRRKSLADLIDLSDLDTPSEDLLDMNEQEFTRAVLYYLEGDRLGMDAMRDPDVIERTYDTIDRLLRQYRRRATPTTPARRPPSAG
jgi:hypothetical protein